MTVEDNKSGHGKRNGNLEYSSTIVSIYLFLEDDCFGPMKSTEILSNGLFDLMMCDFGGL